MKNLRLLLITVLLLMTVHMLNISGMLMTPETRIQLLTAKPTYVPGEKIQIIGAFNPNDVIHIDLVNPFDGTKNSTLLQSDNTGHFRTNYVVPYDAVNGTWKILATSGVNHASLDIQVISSNYGINENTTRVYGHSGSATSMKIESPLKQFKSGIKADNIKCDNGFSLVIKAEDYSPTCVKPDTASKLVERGWALTRLSISGLKETYRVGEKIGSIIDFQGILRYCDHPDVSVLDSNQNMVWKSQDVNSMCISAPFSPLPYVDQNFDLNSGYGGPIIINKTGNYAMKVSLDGSNVEQGFAVK